MNIRSILNPDLEVTQTKPVMTLLRKGHRKNGRKGLVGILILEMIGIDGRPFVSVIGTKFGLDQDYEAHKITLNGVANKTILLRSIGYWQEDTKTDAPTILKGQRFAEGSWSIDINKLNTLNTPKQKGEATMAIGNMDYSFAQAVNILKKLDVPLKELDLKNDNEKRTVRWNPFARLKESKSFSSARVRRSSFWERIKDTFFILHGDGGSWKKNEIGLLDYIFPFPRAIQNLAIVIAKQTKRKTVKGFFLSVAAFLVILPALPLMGVKWLAAAVLTGIASVLFVAPVHLALMYQAKKNNDSVNNLTIKKINDDTLEDIRDLNAEDDLEDETTLKQSFSQKEISQMLIKPLARDERKHYSLVKESNPKQVKYLGLYDRKSQEEPTKKGAPKAIIEINKENHAGVRAMLKLNMFRIDNALEKIEAVETVAKVTEKRRP